VSEVGVRRRYQMPRAGRWQPRPTEGFGHFPSDHSRGRDWVASGDVPVASPEEGHGSRF
jgi:hypothetical protein